MIFIRATTTVMKMATMMEVGLIIEIQDIETDITVLGITTTHITMDSMTITDTTDHIGTMVGTGIIYT